MSETPEFQEFYFREIGVHTPLHGSLSKPKRPSSSDSAPVTPVAELSSKPTAHSDAVQESDSLQTLETLASTCTACQLSEQRHNVVFGVGNPQAEIVFIGEAPGREEDLKGEPFVGRAGKLLDRMLAAQQLDRSQVYIMNTVKCRPPNNRDPKPEEVQACGRWFDAQLKLLSPRIICLLGRVAAQTVLETDASLSALRGKWHDYRGIPVWVMYHPAYLLRSPQQKRHAWRDLCLLNQRRDQLS